MQTIEQAFQLALKEIGSITPWWSDEDGMYIFEHHAYPMVCYANPDPAVVTARYKEVLKDFVTDRLDGRIAPTVEKITRGKGGYRPGAGRPLGTRRIETRHIRVPADIVDKVRSLPNGWDSVRSLLQG